MADLATIEGRIDRVAAGAVEISATVGGLKFDQMIEVMETAKLLAVSGPIIPKWLQGNPGGCWAIIIQAVEWRMSPLAVARMSYDVNGQIGFGSQLIHAVIESRAPLKQRLRCDYEGEGQTRVCVVTGHIKGEATPLVLRTPKLGDIKPQNSPLWKTDPDQQLWYYGSRTWCRRFCPDVLLGIYGADELRDNNGEFKDVTPKTAPTVADRLKGPGGKRGFSAEHVEQETAKTIETVDPKTGEITVEKIETETAGASATDAPADNGGAATEGLPASGATAQAETQARSPRTASKKEAAADATPAAASLRSLTTKDKNLARKYAERIADTFTEPALQKGSAAFIRDHGIEEGTLVGKLAAAIFNLHRSRVLGESSPAEVDAAVKELLA